MYVNDNKCDIGLSIGIPDAEIKYNYWLFKKNQLCATMHPNHALSSNETVTLEQVSKYPLIMKNETYKSFEFIHNLSSKRNIPLDIQTKSLTTIIYKQLEQSKNSIAIGTTYLTNTIKDFICIPFEEPELNWDIYIITKKGHYLSDKALKLIDDLIVFGQSL